MEYEIKRARKFSFGIKEIWSYRELFFYFALRDIKVKYKQTILGFLWAVLQPFIMMVLFTIFFGIALEVPSGNELPYPVFVYSGLLIWNIFSAGLLNASNSMVSNANIIKKIYFPRLIIPISSIIVALFDFLMSLVIFVGILIYYSQTVNALILLYLPLSILITLLLTIGMGCWLSSLNLKYRDFRYIVPFLIQMLLFLTPVIYPVAILKFEWVKILLSLNPLTGAIELFRCSLSDNLLDVSLVINGVLVSSIFFFTGVYFFRRTEFYFADLA